MFCLSVLFIIILNIVYTFYTESAVGKFSSLVHWVRLCPYCAHAFFFLCVRAFVSVRVRAFVPVCACAPVGACACIWPCVCVFLCRCVSVRCPCLCVRLTLYVCVFLCRWVCVLPPPTSGLPHPVPSAFAVDGPGIYVLNLFITVNKDRQIDWWLTHYQFASIMSDPRLAGS